MIFKPSNTWSLETTAWIEKGCPNLPKYAIYIDLLSRDFEVVTRSPVAVWVVPSNLKSWCLEDIAPGRDGLGWPWHGATAMTSASIDPKSSNKSFLLTTT